MCIRDRDQTVHAELAIVWRIAKITAVSRPRVAVFIIFNQRLIDPVPDEAALDVYKRQLI